MASGAIIACLAVVKRGNHRTPHVGGVASFAQFGSERMRSGFESARANPIMATRTVARLPCHRAMVEYNLLPTTGVVAYITRLISGNMIGTLARCNRAVVTVFTAVSGLTVING